MLGPIAGTALDEFVRVYMLKVQIINGSPNHSLSLGIGFSLQPRREIDMGFLVTTLIFMVIGIIASLCTRICCNRGPSTNLFHLTLIITATVCCWMMWAIVYLAQMKPLIVPILSEGE